MVGRSELSDAISLVEARVRDAEHIDVDELSSAFRALDDLQSEPGLYTVVAREARLTQYWLNQYVATLIDGAAGAPQPEREAKLRAFTLQSCEDLRIAIARSWVGAA